MKRIEYTKGQEVGSHGIIYLNEENPIICPSGSKRRLAKFKCTCGKEYISRVNDVRNNSSKSCGCSKGIGPKKHTPGSFINGIKFIKSLGITKKAQRGVFECPVCKKEWESFIANIQNGNTKSCCSIKRGWSRKQWIDFCNKKNKKTVTLYKVLLFNKDESFIKIGITSNSTHERIATLPYDYEVLKEITGSPGYIYDLENRTKRMFKNKHQKPLMRFKGETECYTKN